MSFISENLGTVIIAVIVAAVIIGVAVKLIRDRKNGKSSCSCGCGCSNCPMSGECHK